MKTAVTQCGAAVAA